MPDLEPETLLRFELIHRYFSRCFSTFLMLDVEGFLEPSTVIPQEPEDNTRNTSNVSKQSCKILNSFVFVF